MNKWEKAVQQSLLDSEETAMKELERQYKAALISINEKVKLFQADIDLLDQALNRDGLDENTKAVLLSQKRSKIYQQQFQQSLKSQVGGIIDKLHSDSYTTIDKYLKGCYEAGYIGTMYDIAKQGIPLMLPLNQAAIVKAVLTDSKVKKGYYEHLGVDYARLKKVITQQISRGIASSLPYSDIARNINNASKSGLYNAKRIVRTEGHRIQQTSARDAQEAAKARGADVVKQWDASLDGRTRDSHRHVDGEIRELDEKFSNGLMFPGDPHGSAEEVINCRCTCNTRARWALDEEELQTLKERAKYFGLDKSKNFEEFREKYIEAANQPEYLRNNLPRNYKDTRTVGKPITKRDLDDILSLAKSMGVQIGTDSKPKGGFETYCGDTKVLQDIITETAKQTKSGLFQRSGGTKVILMYDNVLGYDGDRSKVDIGAFAETKGRTITLNKYMFDDSSFLVKEYEGAVASGFFVKGTTYKSIIAHETGHIIDKKTKGLYDKIVSILEKEAAAQGVPTNAYIMDNLSAYAGELNSAGKFNELIPEVNSLLNSGIENDIIRALRKAGVVL